MESSPKHICSINKFTTMEIPALPSWVKAEAGNLYVVRICMDKKKKTQRSGIWGISLHMKQNLCVAELLLIFLTSMPSSALQSIRNDALQRGDRRRRKNSTLLGQ